MKEGERPGRQVSLHSRNGIGRFEASHGTGEGCDPRGVDLLVIGAAKRRVAKT